MESGSILAQSVSQKRPSKVVRLFQHQRQKFLSEITSADTEVENNVDDNPAERERERVRHL